MITNQKVHHSKKQTGFTLIEIISVVVLLGVLAAVAMSGISGNNQQDLYAYIDTLKGNLRFAQINAMTTEGICTIEFTGNTYEYKDETNSSQVLPGQSQTTIAVPAGFTLSLPNTPIIAFDAWGRPGTARTPTDSNGLLDASVSGTDIQILVSNSEETKTIKITQETGYIDVQ